MADKTRYPQIPSTVWWGLRSILQRTPRATIDEGILGAQIGVQSAAAKQYISELRAIGILTEDGKATSLANKWRLDETYQEAAQEIIRASYPVGLVEWAPPEDANRQNIMSWFERQGLGTGSARNKAATYLLLGSSTPNDAPQRASSGRDIANRPTQRTASNASATSVARNGVSFAAKKASSASTTGRRDGRRDASAMPLNINVQIHISADAGQEQIESIFSAMKRYLNDSSDT